MPERGQPPAPVQFTLESAWELASPVEAVWSLLRSVATWPQWWRPNLRAVTRLREGDPEGVGQIDRFTWRGALPYVLHIDIEVLELSPQRRIVGRARGDVSGTGTWSLRPTATGTQVHYCWQVDVDKPWMRRLLPLLRPVFAWNHHAVMRAGAAGMARALSGPPSPPAP